MAKSIFDGEPEPPLHIGEAMACWTYYAMLMEAVAYEQAALNTTTDNELLGMVNDAVKLCNDQGKRLKEFMHREGITLPPVSEDKPKSDPNAIPPGVKITDNEIANGLALKSTAGLIHCATSAAASVRVDVGILWSEFLAEQLTYGMTLKTKMRKRGWLKHPPSFTPPGIGHK
jgi:putative hemolysin